MEVLPVVKCDPFAYLDRLTDLELKFWIDRHREEKYCVPTRKQVARIIGTRGK